MFITVSFKFVLGTFKNLNRELNMLGTVLLIILILLLVGALPAWPYSAAWGYYPSGLFTILLVILIVLLLTGRI